MRVFISPKMHRNEGSEKDSEFLGDSLFLGITSIIISVLGID